MLMKQNVNNDVTNRDRGVGGGGAEGHVPPPQYFEYYKDFNSKKKCLVPPQYWVTNGAPPISKLLRGPWRKIRLLPAS